MLTPINYWDMGTFDGISLLSPTNSILQANLGVNPSPTNIFSDPKVIGTHDIPLTFTSWRTNRNFTGAIMVTADLNPSQMGDYHLLDNTSPAYNAGAASKAVPAYQQPPTTLPAPAFDIDNYSRPGFGAFDIGADEIALAKPFAGLLDDFNRAEHNRTQSGCTGWSKLDPTDFQQYLN